MDQERDDGTRRTAMTPATDETARLRADIEDTRAQMSGTIGELSDRLRPEHLAERATTAVKQAVSNRVRGVAESASDVAKDAASKARAGVERVAEQARLYPVPASMAVGSAGWYLMRRRRRARYDADRSAGLLTGIAAGALAYYAATQLLDRDDDWSVDGDRDGAGSESRVARGVRRIQSSMSGWRDSATEKAQEYGEKASEKVQEYSGRMGATMRQVGQSARTHAAGAKEIMREQRDEWRELMDRWMTENPLALGAAAFAIGTVAGLSLPQTRAENRAFGRARQTIVNRVQDAVDDALPK